MGAGAEKKWLVTALLKRPSFATHYNSLGWFTHSPESRDGTGVPRAQGETIIFPLVLIQRWGGALCRQAAVQSLSPV